MPKVNNSLVPYIKPELSEEQPKESSMFSKFSTAATTALTFFKAVPATKDIATAAEAGMAVPYITGEVKKIVGEERKHHQDTQELQVTKALVHDHFDGVKEQDMNQFKKTAIQVLEKAKVENPEDHVTMSDNFRRKVLEQPVDPKHEEKYPNCTYRHHYAPVPEGRDECIKDCSQRYLAKAVGIVKGDKRSVADIEHDQRCRDERGFRQACGIRKFSPPRIETAPRKFTPAEIQNMFK